ncbi:hypothetical protein KUTeg_011586 [Tegillarca granosa]|uniref:YqaJ viral recombinase domain-containing protein n=1 Tax=Tegillarca granosa TaxID=220873 RepID=A0ABQ9EZI2_TEGGR|nr:hypothetical protein KUTeg_011586 [Tegillarca granosa]
MVVKSHLKRQHKINEEEAKTIIGATTGIMIPNSKYIPPNGVLPPERDRTVNVESREAAKKKKKKKKKKNEEEVKNIITFEELKFTMARDLKVEMNFETREWLIGRKYKKSGGSVTVTNFLPFIYDFVYKLTFCCRLALMKFINVSSTILAFNFSAILRPLPDNFIWLYRTIGTDTHCIVPNHWFRFLSDIGSLDNGYNRLPEAIQWGIDNESRAKKDYADLKAVLCNNFKIKATGLTLCKTHSFIGASVDGRITDETGTGVLEVKCPFSVGGTNETHMQVSDVIALGNKNFCLENLDEGPRLKRSQNTMHRFKE